MIGRIPARQAGEWRHPPRDAEASPILTRPMTEAERQHYWPERAAKEENNPMDQAMMSDSPTEVMTYEAKADPEAPKESVGPLTPTSPEASAGSPHAPANAPAKAATTPRRPRGETKAQVIRLLEGGMAQHDIVHLLGVAPSTVSGYAKYLRSTAATPESGHGTPKLFNIGNTPGPVPPDQGTESVAGHPVSGSLPGILHELLREVPPRGQHFDRRLAWLDLWGETVNYLYGDPVGESTIEMATRLLADHGVNTLGFVRALAGPALGIRVCRVCGCTDLSACDAGCEWVADDICSACIEDPS